ncbi:MAG TPA: hypothetical protein VI382_02535, partial [Candidatus Manganitrophaceae bacterium]|nr:hypothetical protein [Candidatus Manganitrophaceae bacterium]
MRRWIGSVVVIGAMGWMAAAAEARDFKVYGYATPDQGEAEVSYWLDYFIRSDQRYVFLDGQTVDKERLFRHTFELEYGVTDRWTIAGYLDFEDPNGKNPEYVQARAVVSRYRLFKPKERLFDTALYFEYYLPYERYRTEEHLETRLIFEKEIQPLLIRLNPIFDKKLSGVGLVEGMEFEYAVGFYLPASREVRLGLEFYGEMGPLSNLNSPKDQEHFIFPTVQLTPAKGIGLELG